MKLTVSEKLLVAAYDLERGGDPNFSAEELVVAAWRRFPRTFGLRGMNDDNGNPIYPDSNRVFAEIMGSKPIRQRGYLTKVGKKTYQLTESGRQVASGFARNLEGGEGRESSSDAGKASISRGVLSKLNRLLCSRAIRRAQDGELERITFHDACVFLGITPRSTAIEMEGSITNIRSVIEETEKAVSSGASEIKTGNADLSQSTTELLRRVYSYLLDRFNEEFDTIRERNDQRKA